MVWLLLLFGCRERLGPEVESPTRRPAAAWGRTLAQVVDRAGNVDYDRLAEDREVLDTYLLWIARPEAMQGKTGQQPHAFWLNAFNALVLHQVVVREVQTSVNEVPSLLPWEGSRFWWGTEYVVAGQPMSLWELGHERVTHINQDYRDFGALAVAARGGPQVPAVLFSAAEVDGQLDDQFHRFLMSDRGLRFGPDGSVQFNPVFDRYDLEVELYTSGVDLCSLAAFHTTGERQARLLALADRGCEHGYFEFDWALNRSEAR